MLCRQVWTILIHINCTKRVSNFFTSLPTPLRTLSTTWSASTWSSPSLYHYNYEKGKGCLRFYTIMITRPKPAYGRQGLAGSWGQDTDEVSTFLVFLTSHFPLATLSSDLTNQGPLMTMKIHLETLKKHGNQPKTMKNHETTLKNHGNQPKTIQNNLEKP